MSEGALGRIFADGEVIVREGDVGDCMYTVQEGRLEVVSTREGRGEVRLSVMEKGDIFGEMAIFERQVRSATVRALGPARVLTVDRRTFLSRVQEDPTLAFNLVRMMSERIRSLSAQVGERRSGTARRQHADRPRGPDRRRSAK